MWKTICDARAARVWHGKICAQNSLSAPTQVFQDRNVGLEFPPHVGAGVWRLLTVSHQLYHLVHEGYNREHTGQRLAASLVSGPVYTKRQRQRCDNSVMMLVILFSLKSVESLENRLQPRSGATSLFSMRTESLASSLSCCSVDADAWCKRALRLNHSLREMVLYNRHN